MLDTADVRLSAFTYARESQKELLETLGEDVAGAESLLETSPEVARVLLREARGIITELVLRSKSRANPAA